jgi:acetyl esterase/lipase
VRTIGSMRLSWAAVPIVITSACSHALNAVSAQAFVSIPFDYEVLANVTYVHRAGWDGKLDLYLPTNRTAATPTLVWFHGGGWTRSSKEQELFYVLPYLYRRWSVINVEYRLADVAKAPAAVSDGLCAMRWLAKHTEEYKVQLVKLVVSGISAGGGMALIVGTMPASSPLVRDCGPDSEFGELPVPVAIVNWFGPSNLADLIDGAHRQAQVAAWFENVADRSALADALSPVMYIRSRVPAVITIHGERDEVVPYAQSVALHHVLDRVGTPNQLVRIAAGHGDFTPAQASYAYDRVFRYINEAFNK